MNSSLSFKYFVDVDGISDHKPILLHFTKLGGAKTIPFHLNPSYIEVENYHALVATKPLSFFLLHQPIH